MMRRSLVALFALLLLAMQHEILVHAFQHDAARLAASKKSLSQTTAEGSCVTCVLNAGGAHGIAAPQAMATHAAAVQVLVGFRPHPHDSLAAVYYASRAPPVPA
jgi:hypothetical protein